MFNINFIKYDIYYTFQNYIILLYNTMKMDVDTKQRLMTGFIFLTEFYKVLMEIGRAHV